MTQIGEGVSPPRMTVEELNGAFNEFDTQMLPHHLPAFFHEAADSPQNQVIDGVLHIWNGRQVVLASEEELTHHDAVVAAAKVELAEQIGLQDATLFDDVKAVTYEIAHRKKLEADGISIDTNLARTGLTAPSVDVFLRSVREVAALTGETYRVYGNAFQTMDAYINSETDTMEILLEGFRQDKKVSEDLKANPHLDDDYKELTSVQRLVETYGLGPAILEAPEVPLDF